MNDIIIGENKGGAGHQMGKKRNFLGRGTEISGRWGGRRFQNFTRSQNNVGLAGIFNDFLFESKTKKLWYFKVGYVLRQCWRNRIFGFFGGGGGEIVAIFHPPPKKVSTILAVFVIQGYKFFWRNKSKFVGQKKFFLMGNQKRQKKMVLKIWKSQKWVKFEHLEKIALWENLLGLFVVILFVIFFLFSPKKLFYRFRETKRIHSKLFEKN